ncbi:SETMAR [Cordylochernes scorpioides]|uniref:SETMAR n=1 Tax=Cordylochernes scorpioides TaxID=51811 RepID=A0ABY6LC96_9ARAC|nr:SETMAR [Cordylochernes scorpioides]
MVDEVDLAATNKGTRRRLDIPWKERLKIMFEVQHPILEKRFCENKKLTVLSSLTSSCPTPDHQPADSAWEKGAISERNIRRWFVKFRNGDTSLRHKEGCGRPLVVDDDHLMSIIEAERNKASREVAEELNANRSTVKRVGKVKISTNGAPYKLSENQK